MVRAALVPLDPPNTTWIDPNTALDRSLYTVQRDPSTELVDPNHIGSSYLQQK